MRTLLLLAATALTAAVAAAQPAGPVVEVRVRPVNDLLDTFEYFGDFANQSEAAKQAAAFLRASADPKKGIEGIDPARPIGLYGFVTKDVVNSSAVLMVPVADEAAVLDLLTGKAGLTPKKRDDGAYEVDVPNVPTPLFFRFADKYAYVTARDVTALDPKGLIAPKAFFTAKDAALIAAEFHLDRLPEDMKTTLFGQLELKVADAKKLAQPGETSAQARLREWAVDQLLAATKDLLADGKTLGVRLAVDPKSDDLTTEVTLSAVKASGLAKVFRGLGGRTAIAAGLAAAKNPLASFGAHLGLAEAQQKEFAGHVDALLKETKEKAKDAEKVFLGTVLDAVAPTLKAGEIDFGLVVDGPDADGHLSLVGGLKLVKGTEVEKLVKLFGPFAPKDKAAFSFDVEKAGGVSLHKAVVQEPKLEEVFGTTHVWLGLADDRLLVGIEPNGKAVRAAAEQGEQKAGVASAEVAIARLAPLVDKNVPPDRMREITTDVFGGSAATGRDAIRLTVAGGDGLTVRLVTKGKAVRFLAAIGQAGKQ